ncbi:MAG: hypothetical protein KDJ15_05025 [Alphaproteobacteria bacterium]|nr:hypothetical protein [Alphaproteobacteria bacterium]
MFVRGFLLLALCVLCVSALAAPAALAESVHGAQEAITAIESTADGAHAEHASKEAGLPQFDPSTYASQVFWLAVAFLILYVFFSTRILPAISGLLENRQAHIQGDLETAERLKNEAESVQKTYDDSLSSARAQASETLAAMHEKIKAHTIKQNKAFQEKTTNELHAVESRIAKATEDAIAEMDAVATNIATDILRKLTGIETTPEEAGKILKSMNKKEAA